MGLPLGALDRDKAPFDCLPRQALRRAIDGRCAASQIASASAASFFCRLTKGLTYAGAINRTSCPSRAISRPQ